MPIGNVSIQAAGGGTTYGVIPAAGGGLSFLNVLYRYANLTLPYSPNDPGLTYTYNNSTLAPVVLLYARFFNLLNEPSVALIANVGTTAFPVSGAPAVNCLDVRGFGAKGDGVTDDTAAIQAALDQAASNYLGNQSASGTTSAVPANLIQSATGHIENGSGTSVTVTMPLLTTSGNQMIIGLTAFNYGGVPAVTDSAGNSYTQVVTVANGQFNLYLYRATIGTAGVTTVTVALTGKNYNSFISVVASEFSGILTPVNVDRTATAIFGTAFVSAPLPHTSNNDVVFSLAVNSAAAGVTAPVPPGFTLVGGQQNPQPNGLSGAVPVTMLSYGPWNGIATITPKWGGATWNGATLSVSMQVKTVSAPATLGLTTVCIPAGVNCMVNPVALDERNFPSNSCRYGTAAYSLLIQDGVTLEIDGSLIANKAANESMVSSTHNNSFGWFLIMNKNWLQNSTIFTPYNASGAFAGLDGGGQAAGQNHVASGLQSLTSTIPTFGTSSADTVVWMSIAEATVAAPYPTIPSPFVVIPSGTGPPAMTAYANYTTPQTFNLSMTYNFGTNASICSIAAAFKALPGVTPVFTTLASQSGGDHGTLASSVVIPAGSMILVVWYNQENQQTTMYNLGSVSDSNGNSYSILAGPQVQGFDSQNLLHFGCMCSLAACFNPKTTTGQSINYSWACSPLNIGGGTVHFYLVTGLGACGTGLVWSSYITGTVVNEGTRNKNIAITGKGKVVLNGDYQVNNGPTGLGQFFPTGLARFVATDSSSISGVEIVNPFGCAVQWLNSNNATVTGLFVHDAAGSPAYSGAQDPGLIEMDMLRNSTISSNILQNCGLCRGILDWVGYQNTISGNTMTSDYTGYEYRDMGGEWGYFFSPSSVITQNSEISGNRATSCTTDPASAGFAGAMAGSNGFLFLGGFFSQTPRSSVTGISFHDNIGNNNSTDFSYDTYVSFRSLVNNTFGSSSGSSGSPPGGVANGQTTVTGEVPTGVVDGVNATFALAHPPIASTISVYLNGLNEVLGTDYTISGNHLIFTAPPASGGRISVTYQYITGT